MLHTTVFHSHASFLLRVCSEELQSVEECDATEAPFIFESLLHKKIKNDLS